MVFFKSFVSIFLFLTVLIQPFAFVGLMEKIVYVGIVIPILLQKIWFGRWINYKNNKNFWINILFSIFFIIAAVFATDVFLVMKILVSEPNYASENNLLDGLLFAVNRFLFFFAILYLWNGSSLKKDNKILRYIFNILRFLYTIVAISVIIWLFYTLIIYIAI